ncbi:MAG: hypothetical protein EBT07_16590, partial [Actinobacteria bacterium]|nr:hypothetical protein [Actinomycetota bacterium]
ELVDGTCPRQKVGWLGKGHSTQHDQIIVIKTAPQLFAVGREVFVVEPDHFVFFRGGELFHPTFTCQLKSTFFHTFFCDSLQNP